jgi:hypothetical protein
MWDVVSQLLGQQYVRVLLTPKLFTGACRAVEVRHGFLPIDTVLFPRV